MSAPISVKVKKLPHYDEALPLPRYETPGSAGADLRASLPDRKPLEIPPQKRVLVPTGLAFEMIPGHEIQVRPRSGLALKSPLFWCNAPGTIDSDYRGEIKIILANLSTETYFIEHGERIAQMVVSPVPRARFEVVSTLSPSQRGEAGFGSTGRT
ncbi:MAG: dUTP diphosphatase [Bacteriovoracales bacterium]|nr:dUTP diphosphatase [Bacteriovoracales bacterium]